MSDSENVNGPSTLERLIPELAQENDATGRETLLLHLQRYEFAASIIPGGAKVVDIACGVGYGAHLMAGIAKKADSFIGVDISDKAIAYAKRHYADDRIEFVVADAMNFEWPDTFDVAVSLETIEHLPEPRAFVQRLLTLLKPNGIFVGSVPTTPSVDVNPYHLHDFSARSFRTLLKSLGLEELQSLKQRQSFNPIRIAGRKEKRLSDLRSNLLAYYAMNPASLLKRLAATATHGFNNEYITIIARKNA